MVWLTWCGCLVASTWSAYGYPHGDRNTAKSCASSIKEHEGSMAICGTPMFLRTIKQFGKLIVWPWHTLTRSYVDDDWWLCFLAHPPTLANIIRHSLAKVSSRSLGPFGGQIHKYTSSSNADKRFLAWGCSHQKMEVLQLLRAHDWFKAACCLLKHIYVQSRFESHQVQPRPRSGPGDKAVLWHFSLIDCNWRPVWSHHVWATKGCATIQMHKPLVSAASMMNLVVHNYPGEMIAFLHCCLSNS